MTRKVWIVAAREYLAVVKRWGFIVTVVMIPVAIVVPSLIMGVFSLQQVVKEEQKPATMGLVDEAQILDASLGLLTPESEPRPASDKLPLFSGPLRSSLDLPRGLSGRSVSFKVYPALEPAYADLKAGRLRGFYRIPPNYVKTGRIMFYNRSEDLFGERRHPGSAQLEKLLIDHLLRGKVSDPIVRRVKVPLRFVDEMVLDKSGQVTRSDLATRLYRNLVPVGFSVLLMIALFIASGYLLHGVATEKGDRVMELLLSSVTPKELMAGKLIGLGAAGLTQVLIWLAFAMGPLILSFGQLRLSFIQIFLSLLYFLLGYLLFGSLVLGLGSLGGTQQEAQQLAGVITFLAALPMAFTGIILTNPDSTLARLLSFIPFTAPNFMVMRLGIGHVSWLDTVLSLTILVIAVYLTLGLAAKFFRIGVLLYGKRPTIPEIWRWVRG